MRYIQGKGNPSLKYIFYSMRGHRQISHIKFQFTHLYPRSFYFGWFVKKTLRLENMSTV